MLPRLAIVDPLLALTLGPETTAATGMDAKVEAREKGGFAAGAQGDPFVDGNGCRALSEQSTKTLDERVRMARARQASLFVSIHADALKKSEGEAQGATIYTVSDTASDAEAARLAENENRADVIAGIDLSREPDDVAEILVDLAQRETKTFSLHFAKSLVTELRNVARLHKHPMKSAGFRVLKAPDVPSVLVELGYVSNKEDLKQLVSGAWRSRTAASIVQAVDTFFNTRMAGSAGSSQ